MIIYFANRSMEIQGSASTGLPGGFTVVEDTKTEEIETGIKTMLLNIRGRFLSLPAKLSPALAAMGGDQASIFDELKHAIDETLEELRDFNVAFAQEEDGDGEKEE